MSSTAASSGPILTASPGFIAWLAAQRVSLVLST